ncbi:MAG: bifunctional UDP-N-acetylglucosamine diphosphorylase/glucosamine-1-phosphate N-acetyltransferase GlmU, partial [Pseudomonadota bacterium]
MVLITQFVDNPHGYGRICRNDAGQVVAIVEQKDANEAQQQIKEVNTGILAVDNRHLHDWLPKLSNDNAQGEYYLTDLVAMAVENGFEVNTMQAHHDYEVQGVNSKTQLVELERVYQTNRALQLLEQGVHVIDPARIDVRGELTVGAETFMDVNCVFEGTNVIGKGVHIEPNCLIKNSVIGDGVVIKANTLIEDSTIENDCELGPFARIRPQTHLKERVKVGNFVETKKSTVGVGSKVNHLSYIGDADIGENSNIGAGTITCNYDGVNKHKTIIGNEVRIGSNSSLVAPVVIHDRATTGAGTVVRSNVEREQLAVSGGKQKNISGWKRPEK